MNQVEDLTFPGGLRVVGKIVKLERSILSWKESFEVGKLEMKLERYVVVGKLQMKLERYNVVGKLQMKLETTA